MGLPWKTAQKPQEFQRLPVGQIRKNPHQPRKLFDAQALDGLANSIRQYGVITPLTVRRTPAGYELIAGERRLRAAMMAGLTTVPCYIVAATDADSALMALLENLQRTDLDCFEEAEFLRQLCTEFHLTQQEAAVRVGKTQSAVANKLRLLRLSADIVAQIRSFSLSERHARTLLQLPEAQRPDAARYMGEHGLTVSQAENYVQSLLKIRQKPVYRGIIRDVRLFCNTVERAVKLMRDGGTEAQVQRKMVGDTLILTVRVPAARKTAPPLLPVPEKTESFAVHSIAEPSRAVEDRHANDSGIIRSAE